MRTHDLRMGFFYFIKPRYDLKNYESVGGTTKQFILFGGKANSIFGFFRLSLSLQALLTENSWGKRSRTPGLLIKSTRSLNP